MSNETWTADSPWPISMPDFPPEGYIAPAIVEEGPEPTPEEPKIPCPECDRTFISAGGLGRHRQTAHNKARNKGKMHCPMEGCESWFHSGSLGRHLRQVHNVFGGVSGVTRKRKPAAKSMEVAEVPTNGHKAEKLAAVDC